MEVLKMTHRRKTAQKKTHCTCGRLIMGDIGDIGDVGDIGYHRKRRRTRRLSDIGAVRSTCKIIRIPGRGVRRGCYNAKGQFRFKKM